jgi:hypothetical protein
VPRFSLLLAACLLAACGASDAGLDTGPQDAGPGLPDAGLPDAGPADAGPADAGPGDAGEPDAGPPPAPLFVDLAPFVGLTDSQNENGPCAFEINGSCEPFQFSGGAAVTDIDGDGLPDLLLTQVDGPPRLYRQVTGEDLRTFRDVAPEYGLDAVAAPTNGAAFADVDRDGDEDLVLTTLDPRLTVDRYVLLLREGDSFEEAGAERGVALPSGRTRAGYGVAVGDYDRDGWVDLHTSDWHDLSGLWPSHSRLLRNRGAEAPGFFVDETVAAGVASFGPDCTVEGGCPIVDFASAFVDFDDDGWPDLLAVRDFGLSRLYWNEGDGTFTDGTEAAGVGTDENGMGSTVGDIDGDGDLDWFVTSIGDPNETCGARPCNWGFSGNRLYRNDGDRAFTDITEEAGVRMGGWGWGAAFLDFDNDGDLDLVMTNGAVLPESTDEDALFNDDPMVLWENDGSGRFTDVSARLDPLDLGDGKGLVVFDADGDGDQDFLVVHHGGPPLLYTNAFGAGAGSWLRVDPVSTVSAGPGVEVRVWRTLEEAPLLRTNDSVTHFLGQSERVAHFGLGPDVSEVARVEVTWPSGRRLVLEDVQAWQTLHPSEDAAE